MIVRYRKYIQSITDAIKTLTSDHGKSMKFIRASEKHVFLSLVEDQIMI